MKHEEPPIDTPAAHPREDDREGAEPAAWHPRQEALLARAVLALAGSENGKGLLDPECLAPLDAGEAHSGPQPRLLLIPPDDLAELGAGTEGGATPEERRRSRIDLKNRPVLVAAAQHVDRGQQAEFADPSDESRARYGTLSAPYYSDPHKRGERADPRPLIRAAHGGRRTPLMLMSGRWSEMRLPERGEPIWPLPRALRLGGLSEELLGAIWNQLWERRDGQMKAVEARTARSPNPMASPSITLNEWSMRLGLGLAQQEAPAEGGHPTQGRKVNSRLQPAQLPLPAPEELEEHRLGMLRTDWLFDPPQVSSEGQPGMELGLPLIQARAGREGEEMPAWINSEIHTIKQEALDLARAHLLHGCWLGPLGEAEPATGGANIPAQLLEMAAGFGWRELGWAPREGQRRLQKAWDNNGEAKVLRSLGQARSELLSQLSRREAWSDMKSRHGGADRRWLREAWSEIARSAEAARQALQRGPWPAGDEPRAWGQWRIEREVRGRQEWLMLSWGPCPATLQDRERPQHRSGEVLAILAAWADPWSLMLEDRNRSSWLEGHLSLVPLNEPGAGS